MAEQQKPARLQDVLNYEADSYFTPDEIALIQSTFADKKIINVLRKALLPSIGDLSLPLEQALGSDFWLSGYQWQQIPADEAKILAVARQDTIKFIVGGLVKLRVIANVKEEDEVQAAYRRSKDSAK